MNQAEIKQYVTKNHIVVFGKGTKEQPQCGFTNRAIQVMQQVGKPFEVVNLLADETTWDALEEITQWPTSPQVFVGGEMLGGSDIVLEMFESGELQKKVEAAFAKK